MSCRIKYIDDAYGADNEKDENQRLTDLHFEIGNKLMSFTKFKIPTFLVGNKKILVFPQEKDKADQLKEHIANINDEYDKPNKIQSLPLDIKTESGKIHKVNAIIIDVLEKPVVNSDDYLLEFQQFFTYDNLKKQIQTSDEYLFDNQQQFIEVLLNMRERLQSYVDTNDDYKSKSGQNFKQRIRKLISLISNKNSLTNLEAIYKYISEAVNVANDTHNIMFHGNSNYESLIQEYNNLKLESEQDGFKYDGIRLQKISDLARKLDKIKNKLYIISSLQDFFFGLTQNGIGQNPFEIYNYYKLKEILGDSSNILGNSVSNVHEFKLTILNHFINNGKTPKEAEDLLISARYENMVIKDKDGKVIKEKPTLLENIQKAFHNLEEVQLKNKELMIDTIALSTYPHYLEQFKETNNKFELSLKKTFEQYRDLIELGEDNLTAYSGWLAAPEQMNDDLIFATSRALFYRLRTLETKRLKEQGEAVKSIVDIYGKDAVYSEERKKHNEEMTSLIFEIPENLRVSYLTRNGDKFDEDGKEWTIVEKHDEKHIKLTDGKKTTWVVEVIDPLTGNNTWIQVVETKALITNNDYLGDIYQRLMQDRIEILINQFVEEPDTFREHYLFDKLFDMLDKGNIEHSQLKDKTYVRRMIWNSFYDINFRNSNLDVEEVLKELKTLDYQSDKREIKRWISRYTSYHTLEDGEATTFFERFKLDRMIGRLFTNNEGDKVVEMFVKLKNGTRELIELEVNGDDVLGIYLNGNKLEFDDVVGVYYKGKEFLEFNDSRYSQNRIDLHKSRMTNKKYADYYNFIKNKLDKKNDELPIGQLRNYKLPQLEKTHGTKISVNGFLEAFNFKRKKDKKKTYFDEDGNLQEFNYNGQSIDGFTHHNLKVKYTQRIANQDMVEGDLFISSMAYSEAVDTFNALFDLEPQMRFLKIAIEGNQLLGFEGRKVVDNKKANKFAKTGKKPEQITADVLKSLIDHYMYGQKMQEHSWGKDYDLKKIAQTVRTLSHYQSLALNLISPVSNLMMGMFNNKSLVVGKRFGLTSEVMNKATGLYMKLAPKAMLDYFSDEPLSKKSHLSQLAIVFDAIKGETIDPIEKYSNESLKEKIKNPLDSKNLKDAYGLMFVQHSAVEHKNQLTLMLAYMMTFKLSDGSTMYEAYQKGSKDKDTIDFVYKNGKEVSDQELSRFMANLETLNGEAHGNYGQYQTALIERYPIYGLALMYGRWIYPFYKSRFKSAGYNRQYQEYEYRGYTRWYIKNMVSKAKFDTGIKWENESSLVENISDNWKQILKNGLIGSLSLAKGVTIDQILFFADRLTSGNISKNSEQFNNYLYGQDSHELVQLENETDEEFEERKQDYFDKKKLALVRASWEMSIFTGLLLIGIGLAAMDDDDEEDKNKALVYLEMFIKRFQNEVGAAVPTISPFANYDFVYRKIKDPFVITRLIDSNAELISQLFGVSYVDGGGLDFAINDKYQKDGLGYEKGDYKLSRKMNKSIISPLYQVLRFMTPQEVINASNLMNKNSAFNIKTEEQVEKENKIEEEEEN